MVIARADSNHIERRTYWDWLKHIKDPGTSDLSEIAQQYRHLLHTAVQERMRGCTLAHLSGGMDSTSVALLAQDVVDAGIGTAPLHTVSLVYGRLPHLARERSYIESVLQRETKMVSHQLLGDDLLDFDILSNPPLHDEPYTALWSLTSGRRFVSLAAEIGALTILTGHGADEIHALPPYSIADLLREQRFGKAWREATKWARARNDSPWRTLGAFGFNPIILTWVAGSQWADLLAKMDGDWSVPPWILPDFARRHALRNRARENAQHIFQQCEQTTLSVTLNAIKSRAGDALRWSAAAPLGIANAHPFLDPRLLTFGLGMQSRIEPEPGKMKPVLVEAMRGRLPDKISSRRGKRGFNEVYYLGLGRNLPHLEALVRQAPLEGMINKELFIQHLQEGSLAGVPPRGMQHLSYMLSLLTWLSQQQEWLQVHEKGSIRLYSEIQVPSAKR